MSILTRPLGKQKDKAPKAEAAAAAPSTEVATTRSAAPAGISPIAPRANLMPPELAIGQKQKSVRRGLRLVIVAVAVIAVAGVGGSFYLSTTAQNALVAAKQETANEQARLGKLQDVKNTKTWIAQAEAAQKVGGSTDIDWASFFADLKAHLPEGVELTGVTVESADALTAYPQSTIPLEGERIGTVSITATSSTLPELPAWIAGLSQVKGFADASPQGVTSSDGVYTATLTLHINEDAYSHKYLAETKEGDK